MKTIRTWPQDILHHQGIFPEELLRDFHQEPLQLSTTLLIVTGVSRFQRERVARQVVAQLNKPVCRVNLGKVTRKYIEETEKNIQHAFDRLGHSGSILLFDEADAIFGKRTGLRDSHDRYANMETNYLISRLAQHRGLVIILARSLPALVLQKLRRKRFVITLHPRLTS
uniref:AAA family ATPase n=1 Tax=Roseihalotalea indica TaxID=2867963 RepID=A0AA49JH11_9BACT|nr:AAA family ATPase [Tunicatimonas sp. TK19036]